MNRNHLAGRLKQFNGKLKEQWCKLHNDQIGMMAARRYQIAGNTQAQCGIVQMKSAQQLHVFKNRNRTWRIATNIFPIKPQRTLNDQVKSAHRRTGPGLVSVKSSPDLAQAA
ncbi:MAG: hypothetical protein ACXWJE_12120 [Burkholderiaceae bacterium]